jgi:hypothetical protein
MNYWNDDFEKGDWDNFEEESTFDFSGTSINLRKITSVIPQLDQCSCSCSCSARLVILSVEKESVPPTLYELSHFLPQISIVLLEIIHANFATFEFCLGQGQCKNSIRKLFDIPGEFSLANPTRISKVDVELYNQEETQKLFGGGCSLKSIKNIYNYTSIHLQKFNISLQTRNMDCNYSTSEMKEFISDLVDSIDDATTMTLVVSMTKINDEPAINACPKFPWNIEKQILHHPNFRYLGFRNRDLQATTFSICFNRVKVL